MQKVSTTLRSALTAPNQTARRLSVVVEIYDADAVPGANGFDPAGEDCLKRWAKVVGINFRGVEYERLVLGDTTAKKKFGKQLSDASFTLDNGGRQVVDFENSVGFEGLIVVIRLIDRVSSADLEDSIVWFTGRCEKPNEFDRGSEKVTITAKQILNQTQITIPRRRFSTDDEQGRAPSDPLFEGFRFSQRTAQVRYTERVRRGGFLGALGLSRNVTRYVQYSSHSDATAEMFVPVILGRAQASAIHLAYLDYGTWIHGSAAWCDGQIKAYQNMRSVTPGLSIRDVIHYYGELGGTGVQVIDDPDWVGVGIYSRTAWIRFVSLGTKIDVEDPAPEIVSVILGLLMPLPDASGVFNQKDWTDNPAYISRWLMNSPDYFNLAPEWFDDAEIIKTAGYCDHILVDQTNSETVAYPAAQIGAAGVAYRNYSSTSVLSPHWFLARMGEVQARIDAAAQPANLQYYAETPYIGDDWNGDGVPDYSYNALPTKYRRRYTTNVMISESQQAYEFLHDVIFPSFNGYLAQQANGKLAVKVFRPVDFTFTRTASLEDASELHVQNINPWKEEPGRIVVGAHLGTAEVREVVAARYDTTVSIAVSASGGVATSAAALTGGSASVAPFVTLTVSTAGGIKTINIDGYQLIYSSQTGETVQTVAGMIAALVNSHNALNKYIKAVWNTGEDTVTVSSRIGYLEFDAPLENAHYAAIADPTTAPTLSTSAGGYFQAGTYYACYSYLTAEGETLTSPNGSVTVAENGKIDFPALTLPARALQVRWFLSVEPNGVRLRHAKTNEGQAFSLTQPPGLNESVEPIINSTAEEAHRVAMAFSDRADSSSNLRASNMVQGTFKFPLGSRQPSTNRIDIKYRDASQDFALSELRVKDAAHIKKIKKVNSLSINGAGIDSYHQARRIANQKLATARDGDLFQIIVSDGEALLLEEGDPVCVTEDSGRFKNASMIVEDVTVDDAGDYPKTTLTVRKYRRYFYDDQIQEKLVPLSLVTTAEPNVETQAPRIYQVGAANPDSVKVAVEQYTINAKHRKVQIAPENTFSLPIELKFSAQFESGGILATEMTLTRTTNLNNAETKYVRVAHSSNGETYGDWSNVLAITFADADTGAGGSGGGTPQAPSGGGSGGVIGPGCPALDQYVLVRGASGEAEAQLVADVAVGDYVYNPVDCLFERVKTADVFETEMFEVRFANGTITKASGSHPLIESEADRTGTWIENLSGGKFLTWRERDILERSRIVSRVPKGFGLVKRIETDGETHIYASGATAEEMAVCHNSKAFPTDLPPDSYG